MTGQRVFKHIIGNWPKVYDQGGGCYTLVARHRSPTAENWAEWVAMLAGFWIWWRIFQNGSPDAGWFFLGTVAGMVSCKVITAVMKNVPVLSSGTRIEFNGGEISWKSASGRGLIREDEPRQVRHAVSRNAGAEARRNAKAQRGGKDGVTLYQTTAEVLIDTGPGWMHPHLIAEIADDETREKAHTLAAAIVFVDEAAREERNAWKIQMSQPGALIGASSAVANELD